MRPWIAPSLVAAVLALLLPALPAAAETVHFRSATVPPTPLQLRLAKEQAHPVPEPLSTKLSGELYRPADDGRFPAVVALHGCGGPGLREREDALGARFTALGYALLIADSFGPRGVTNGCSHDYWVRPADRVADAYGALAYLARLPFVDADRIALLGFSQGADVALSAVTPGGDESLFDRHFHTAIAYYPTCAGFNGTVSVPTAILIGELDDWTPAAACQKMMARRSREGAPLRLVIYPGAYHAFNAVTLRNRPMTYMGHHLEYNEAADRAAWAEMVAALRRAFGG
jgi:dienelactone hydrolase